MLPKGMTPEGKYLVKTIKIGLCKWCNSEIELLTDGLMPFHQTNGSGAMYGGRCFGSRGVPAEVREKQIHIELAEKDSDGNHY